MKIIVDAFGGDNAPLEVLKGCERAVKELNIEIILTGSETDIKKCASDNNISLEKMEIVHADEIFDIHEEPSKIIKAEGKNTSMAVGLQLLHDGKGEAFLSAGSTGALVFGATMLVKRIKGIKRPALAPIMPSEKGYFMLLDAGANTECRSEMLVQFGMMGSAYMETVMGVKNPKVSLANIGAEETKGRELELESYKLLQQSPINFTGNIEARDIPKGVADVVVADGYTGNMLLKLYEGMGKFMSNKLKEMFSGFSGKLAGLLSLSKIKLLKKQMDYKEVGGAVLLGVASPVIKAHGSSDANAFYNALRQAKKCVDGKVINKITDYISNSK